MKIAISNATTGQSFTLAPGGQYSPLDDLDLAHTNAVQEATFVRAESIKLFDRKNERFDQNFTVLHPRGTTGSAENWLFEIGRQVPRFGTVVFSTENSPSGARQWQLKDASCQIVSLKQIGSAVLVTFRLRGGKIAPAT